MSNIIPPFAPVPPPTFAETLIGPVDWFFIDFLKLSQPWQRFAVAFVSVTAIQHFLQPEVSYSNDGIVRPWALLDPSNPEATQVPWWVIPATVGLVPALFV